MEILQWFPYLSSGREYSLPLYHTAGSLELPQDPAGGSLLPQTLVLSGSAHQDGDEDIKRCGAWCHDRFCYKCGGRGWAGQVLPVAMKRCVASKSCGEILTLISESESLNREKSCRLLSRCGTLCFFRLSAVGPQGKYGGQNRRWSLAAYTGSLGPHTSAVPTVGGSAIPLPVGAGRQQMVRCCLCLGGR